MNYICIFRDNSIHLFLKKFFSVSINKVLLEHRHVHSFTYCLCFHATKAELSNSDRDL